MKHPQRRVPLPRPRRVQRAPVRPPGALAPGPGLPARALAVQPFPERVCPQEEHCALSPADGRIVRIEQADEPFTGERLTRISIFMNLFDVHVNRMPVDARIEDIRYYPGKFFNASLDKASRDNERCAYALKADDGNFVMVQIAGLIARRIVSYAEPGDMGKKGERIGMIKFGSRVDLYLPQNYAPRVVVGQKVFAGQSIVAIRRQPCSALPSEDRKMSLSPESLPVNEAR